MLVSIERVPLPPEVLTKPSVVRLDNLGIEAEVLAVKVLAVKEETLAVVPKRLVEEAVAAKKLVVVAAVPVALRKVKFCKVEEPMASRLARVVRPLVTFKVPVKIAAEEMVWPLIESLVKVPMLPKVEKRLVEEAVPE